MEESRNGGRKEMSKDRNGKEVKERNRERDK